MFIGKSDKSTDAEFAFKIGDWLTKKASGVGKSLNKAQNYATLAWKVGKGGNYGKGRKIDKGLDIAKKYFTHKNIDGTKRLNYKRAGLAAAGLGAAGYGTYRVGKAGLGMLGIGEKKEEPKRFTLFG